MSKSKENPWVVDIEKTLKSCRFYGPEHEHYDYWFTLCQICYEFSFMGQFGLAHDTLAELKMVAEDNNEIYFQEHGDDGNYVTGSWGGF